MLYNETLNAIPLNVYKKACNSCMVYIVLFVILITNMHLLYFYLFSLVFKKNNIAVGFSVGYLNV